MKIIILGVLFLNIALSNTAISGRFTYEEKEDTLSQETITTKIGEFDFYYQQHSKKYLVLQYIDQIYENSRIPFTKLLLKEYGILTNDQIMSYFLKSVAQVLIKSPEYNAGEDFEFELVEEISSLVSILKLEK